MSREPEPEFAWWWLSFVNTALPYTEEGDRPGGPRWAGGCHVPGPTFLDAVRNSHALGCNPGGEVAGFPIPPGYRPPVSHQCRLLTAEELDEMDYEEDVK